MTRYTFRVLRTSPGQPHPGQRGRHCLASGWGATLLQYLAVHPDMELEEISRALALLARWVDRIVDEGN